MPFAQLAASARRVDARLCFTSHGDSNRSRTGASGRDRFCPIVTALLLLVMGLANIVERATSDEVEDGVLWVERSAGVVAAEVAADSPAERAGVRPGDVLLAIDGQPVEHARRQSCARSCGRGRAIATPTRCCALGTREVAEVRHGAAAERRRRRSITCSRRSASSRCSSAPRCATRRPFDQATLHFFWLAVAFFGTFTFSFTGRFDRVDWFFYWADDVAIALLPPLFLHFALVFPERPHSDGYTAHAGALAAGDLSAGGRARARRASSRSCARASIPRYFVRLIGTARRSSSSCTSRRSSPPVSRCSCARSAASGRSPPRASCAGLSGARRIGAMPFALGYAVPFAFGVPPSLPMELSAIPLAFIPLAFASAIVRYRLMDVEVILKRLLVYTAVAGRDRGHLRPHPARRRAARSSQTEDEHRWLIAFLATVIVLLLARPVKDAVQSAIDRAFYRDRYDYRRALVAFARDLNGDLDLASAGRIGWCRACKETFVVDRMALLLANEAGEFEPLRDVGLDAPLPRLSAGSGIGARLASGHVVRLDDPLAVGRFTAEEVEFWRDAGIYYMVPCVSNERSERGVRARPRARPASRSPAKTWGCSPPSPGRRRRPSRTAASIASCTSRPPSSIGCAPSTRTSSSRSTTACSSSGSTIA